MHFNYIKTVNLLSKKKDFPKKADFVIHKWGFEQKSLQGFPKANPALAKGYLGEGWH